jgi:ribonuclease R
VLEKKGSGDVRPGDLAVVRTGRGRATLERVLGSAARIETVLEGVLVDQGARMPFEPYEPPDRSVEDRVDLRRLVAFTIDPETAKDFDDALSVERDGDGYRAWVHIADVSAFVPVGSPLDHGAARRAFSTYVPGRVAPMLPHELADDLCSLRPHEDRLCVTVEIPFDADLRPGEASFYRSVIRSRRRFSYGEVQRILDGGDVESELREPLALIERLAGELRRRRFARGALRVESTEIAFAFDGEGGVADAWRESEAHAHALVEEFMILANECVAELLASRRREALYRVHERPDPQSVARLLAKLTALEVPTPPAPEADHITQAQAAQLAADASERVSDYAARSGRGREAFPTLVLRALKQARYDPRNLGHSGLASTAYCHFTSPIRRYPDLVVHRALLRELGASDEPVPEDLDALAEHASAREREAAQVEYLADEICLAWLLEDRLFELGWEHGFDGEIIGLIGSGLFVRFGDAFEGFVPVRRLGGDWYEVDALETSLVGRGGARFRLGDPIGVRVEGITRAEGKVELAPARNSPARRTAKSG